MRSFRFLIGLLLPLALFAVFAIAGTRFAAAQASVPDMTQFGFPTVADSTTFTPGTSATLTAGTQQVVLPADFISKTVKFELLTGDASTFAPLLASDDQGRPIVAAFAFRVTDPATGKLVGRFDKPVVWSVTDPRVDANSTGIYNTSPANPPKITDNPTPATLNGQTLTHSFGGAGVGWLALGTAAPAGMPSTGAPVSGLWLLALTALAGVLCATAGLAVRQRQARG